LNVGQLLGTGLYTPALSGALSGQTPKLGESAYRPVNGMPILSAQRANALSATDSGFLRGAQLMTGGPNSVKDLIARNRRISTPTLGGGGYTSAGAVA
jgi:hypothetical protein